MPSPPAPSPSPPTPAALHMPSAPALASPSRSTPAALDLPSPVMFAAPSSPATADLGTASPAKPYGKGTQAVMTTIPSSPAPAPLDLSSPVAAALVTTSSPKPSVLGMPSRAELVTTCSPKRAALAMTSPSAVTAPSSPTPAGLQMSSPADMQRLTPSLQPLVSSSSSSISKPASPMNSPLHRISSPLDRPTTSLPLNSLDSVSPGCRRTSPSLSILDSAASGSSIQGGSISQSSPCVRNSAASGSPEKCPLPDLEGERVSEYEVDIVEDGSPPPAHPSFAHNLRRARSALLLARAELMSTGDYVPCWKIMNGALQKLQVDSWAALGMQTTYPRILGRWLAHEKRVSGIIQRFVIERSITSLYDLNDEICKKEKLETFEDLKVGPLVKHPLIMEHFLVPSDGAGIMKITQGDIISAIKKFERVTCRKMMTIPAFLQYLAEEWSVPHANALGVRVKCLYPLDQSEKSKNNAKRKFSKLQYQQNDVDGGHVQEMGKKMKMSDISTSAVFLYKREVDMRSVFVSNFDYACEVKTLEEHFKTCGDVLKVTIITDKFGVSKGYGYIQFANLKAASTAIDLLNGSEMGGRILKVCAKRTNIPGCKSHRRFRGRF